jgi:hypothetical protein
MDHLGARHHEEMWYPPENPDHCPNPDPRNDAGSAAADLNEIGGLTVDEHNSDEMENGEDA